MWTIKSKTFWGDSACARGEVKKIDYAWDIPSMIDDWFIYNNSNQLYFTTDKSTTAAFFN